MVLWWVLVYCDSKEHLSELKMLFRFSKVESHLRALPFYELTQCQGKRNKRETKLYTE
jgi:hypothetical protein